MYETVCLTPELLDALVKGTEYEEAREDMRSYFTDGSCALCLLSDGFPVFAAGVVDMQWKRGEAWIIPTPFFKSHPVLCMLKLKRVLPILAKSCGFKRIQATCVEGTSAKFLYRLGFKKEGVMRAFGRKGETCRVFGRIF